MKRNLRNEVSRSYDSVAMVPTWSSRYTFGNSTTCDHTSLHHRLCLCQSRSFCLATRNLRDAQGCQCPPNCEHPVCHDNNLPKHWIWAHDTSWLIGDQCEKWEPFGSHIPWNLQDLFIPILDRASPSCVHLFCLETLGWSILLAQCFYSTPWPSRGHFG